MEMGMALTRHIAHSFEELRDAALDILAEREKGSCEPSQYGNLSRCVAEVLSKRDGTFDPTSRDTQLQGADADLFVDVFWALFREGIITLGYNSANNGYPWCRVSHFGKRMIANPHAYFFHDVTGYERTLRHEVPQIDDVTVQYLAEAMNCFRSGCMLASTVMVGVAAEHTFLLLLETIEANKQHATKLARVAKERTILGKLNAFARVIEQDAGNLLPGIKEDLETRFEGIISIIRTFRNQSGHPTGQFVEREQVYVLLQLFIPYCKKVYELIGHYNSPTGP